MAPGSRAGEALSAAINSRPRFELEDSLRLYIMEYHLLICKCNDWIHVTMGKREKGRIWGVTGRGRGTRGRGMGTGRGRRKGSGSIDGGVAEEEGGGRWMGRGIRWGRGSGWGRGN